MINRHLWHAFGLLIIVVAASMLYVPHLSNQLVFDDHGMFSALQVYDYAQKLFDLRPRTFPYFTLGIVQVEFGQIEAHRTISLVIHILCAGMLFALIHELVSQALKNSESSAASEKKSAGLALVGSLWFAIHPVAVYGAGYLVQRTILFATLFSLLSLWFYCRAFSKNRTVDVITAALFYSLAVFSKEHAVMLLFAVIPFAALYSPRLQSSARRVGLYLLLCIPAAITVVISAKSVVASTYEPYVGILLNQIQGIPLLETPLGKWLVSVTLQAGFFFDYLGYWILPDVRSMSIDMRVDFTRLWHTWFTIPKAAIFAICPFVAAYLIRKRGPAALFGCGLLYCWLLFFTELVTVRFQEPFALYRSYLWAPGYLFMVVAVLSYLRLRWVVALSAPLLLGSACLAQERLSSLATESTAWTDAAAKLESKSVVGSARIFYMRGVQYVKEKKYREAIADFTEAISRYPNAPQIYYQRGIAYYSLHEFTKAQAEFDQAITVDGKFAYAHFARGMVFEHFGCAWEARNAYAKSHELGIAVAAMKLKEEDQALLTHKPTSNSVKCPITKG
ncbi:tetratricopeptide repeat protein [Noviherbaspirillum cavernae]|nr:tetratricopeptide repeat protein [Noviherbaspirillum cavernae]